MEKSEEIAVSNQPKMNRKSKNILMSVGIGLSVIGIVSIFLLASQSQGQPGGMEAPGGMMGQPGEMGQMGGDGGTPPEKPDGDAQNKMSEPPEKPDGEPGGQMGAGGTPPEMPNGAKSSDYTWTYISALVLFSLIISFLTLHLIMSKANKKTFKETYHSGDKSLIIVLGTILLTACLSAAEIYAATNLLGTGSPQGQPGGMSATDVKYSTVVEITEDKTLSNQSYNSTTDDENVILATGKINAEVNQTKIEKTGDSNGGDSASFYGMNSGVISKDGATLTLKNLTVTTNATGANGVFSYGGSATTNNSNSDGTTVNITDSTITTTKDNSGGIMTTGGGNMNATNLTILTSGISSAAIRSDRGGGNVSVDGGTYTTKGAGSPAIYSTAAIKTNNAKLVAEASEGVVIEGANSVGLDNTELVDTNNKLNGQSTTYKNIFLYQSLSGDASTEGGSSFTAKNSKITTNKGDTFYVTNTTAKISLENNKITNNDTTGNLLRIQKDSWGKDGSNGGDVTFDLTNQSATGNIVVDSISKLAFNLKSGSVYQGTINGDNSAKNLALTLSKDSKITLTGDSYVSSLDDADISYNNINFNGHKLYVNGKAIN